MKKKPASQSAFFNPRVLISFALLIGALLLVFQTRAPGIAQENATTLQLSSDSENVPAHELLTAEQAAAGMVSSNSFSATDPLQGSCNLIVLPSDGSTSGNARAPSTRYAFSRSVYLITAAELAANGFAPGQQPTSIGWRFSTAPGGAGGSAPLTILLENTTDTTNTKSTTWATAIGTMTTVHSAVTALPSAIGAYDIPFSGGSPFTYTGGGIYVAHDWGQYTGTLSTAAVFACNVALVNGLLGANSNAATVVASSFRPETRLSSSLQNDRSVDLVYSYGEVPLGLIPPQVIGSVVRNKGVNAGTNVPATLNVTGADTFTNMQNIASLTSCSGQSIVSFAPFTPGALGNDNIAVSVPADDFAPNNSRSRTMAVTPLSYSYKHPGSIANGGVGVAGATAALVAKFTTTAANSVVDVKLEFNAASATTYRVVIHADNGSGLPATAPIYIDAADRTVAAAGPVTITLPAPVAVGPGNFFVGINQTNTTNAAFSYDTENPIRTGSFFLAIPTGTAFFDAAPGNNFKFNIGINLQTGGTSPTPSPSATASATVAPTPTATATATAPAGTPSPTPTSTPCGTTALTQNFDGVTAPALPAGWASSFTNGDGDCTVGGALCALGANWTTATTTPDTAPNHAFHNDPACVTNSVLDTPSFAITTAAAQVTFRNNFDMEDTFDGGVLEIAIGGGAFADIITAGGSFVTGGYTDTISTSFLSPIAGRMAWSGLSAGYITTTVNLPASAAGQNVVLRFRFASDCSVADVGWRVDTITVVDGGACPSATPTPGTPSPTPSASPCVPGILYNQADNPGTLTNDVTSQDFEAANDGFDSFVADDFVVPAGQSWTVNQVVVHGDYSATGGPAPAFNVFFHSDSATLPGAVVAGGSFPSATYTSVVGAQPPRQIFTITLPSGVVLPAGTYWVSVQARMDFTPTGQWFWANRLVQANSGAAFQNPGGGFMACPTWGRKTTCLPTQVGPDQMFQIVGTSGGCGTPTPPPGTPTPTPTPSATPTCPPGWSTGGVFPTVGVVRAVGNYFPANGLFYSIGGRTADTAAADLLNPFEYNPATNTWTMKPSTLPDNQVNNMACGVMTVSGTPQIYCVGGSASQQTGTSSRVFSYNPVTDTFTTLTAADNWPGSETGTFLPGGFAVANNQLFIIGKFNATAPAVVSDQVWRFDPNAAVGSRWTPRNPIPVARAYVPAAAIGNLIYTAGGSNLDGGGLLIDTTESFVYDIVSGSWTAIAPIPRAAAETRAVIVNGEVWVLGGGRVAPNPSNQVNIYNPGSNTWTTGVPFATARRNFPADSDGASRVFLAGGYDVSGLTPLNTTEFFGAGVCPTPSPTPATPTPTVTPTPGTPTPTATATATVPPSATPTATVPGPSATPGQSPRPAQAVNFSTRMFVQTGDRVGIGGFIVTGTVPKNVIVRAIGPTLTRFGIDPSQVLADPVLELRGPTGFPTIVNNNWRDTQEMVIQNTGLPPTNDLESAIVASLNPGNYTAVVKGNGDTTGMALVEVYDLDVAAASKLSNISTRAFVGTGDNVVIAGFILAAGDGDAQVIVRGLGPSLSALGVPTVLANPTLDLRDSNGALVSTNNDWQDNPAQEAIISAAGLAPGNPLEAAIAETLPPGLYTALLAGLNKTSGNGLVEVYDLGDGSGVPPPASPTPTPGGGTPTPPPPGTPSPTPPGGGTPTPTPPGGGTPTPTPPPPASPTPSPPSGPCTENFDGVTAPTLPAGWTANNAEGPAPFWVTSVSQPFSPANCAFVPDAGLITDKRLDSKPIIIGSGAVLSFKNNYNTEYDPPPNETFWDGWVLEVSTDDGATYRDFLDPLVGGSCVSGCYTGVITGIANNPISDRLAWCGNSGGYIDTVINLGSILNGQTIRLRFRIGTDEKLAAPGVRVDDIVITNASCP